MKQTLTIATRESPLALWQANWVKTELNKIYPNLFIQLLGLTTIADRMLDISLMKVGGKGLFVKELEEALLENRADIAVHSMKDVPMELPEGLCIPVYCDREDPRDVFVSLRYLSLTTLPNNGIIATSSLRRQSQIYALRPDVKIVNLRGNVETRLEKLATQNYDGIILAAAGLKRLGLEARIAEYLTIEQCLPAPAQGVLGIECRIEDTATQDIIAPLNDHLTSLCVIAERAMCKRLGGGCQTSVAAYAEIEKNNIILQGLVAKEDGSRILRVKKSEKSDQAEALGKAVASELLDQGAGEILSCQLI